MCCATDNHNYMRHTCTKEFLDSNFNEAVIDKISNFHEIAPNSTYINRNFSIIFAIFLDQLLHPLNFMTGTCQEYSFSFLPVVSR